MSWRHNFTGYGLIDYFRVMTLLRVENVSKALGEEKVVKDVSFPVEAFGKLAIVGETGSGKTTLLKMMAGLLQPDAGNVFLESSRVPGPDEVLIPGHKRIAYLSQHFELRNNYRVHEIIDMVRKEEDADVDKILRICQVAHLQHRWSDELSGGEKQRIALARLLISSPKLLLLDEPFSNLDAAHKKTMQAVLRELSEQLQMTCVLVSHEAADILSWAETVVVMQKGQLLQKASPQEIYYRPLNAYVAALTGDYNQLSAGHPLYPTNDEAADKTDLFVRPQHIKVSTVPGQGVEGILQSVFFMGTYYALHILAGEYRVLAYSFQNSYAIGTVLGLKVEI